MPKKRVFNFKQVEGQSSSGSAAGSRQDGGAGSESTATVNERLSALRNVETPEGLQKKRELAASVNQPSVPPELRSILGVPESAPPKPKIGARLRERMRTPGPAAPKSWLATRSPWEPTLSVRRGQGAKGKLNPVKDVERQRPKQFMRFDRLLSLNGPAIDERPPRLLHLALQRLAEQWEMFDSEDYVALAELSLQLRLRLLSYLAYFGPPIDVNALDALTHGDAMIERLDLGGLAGHGPLTIKRIARLLEHDRIAAMTDQSNEVAESWEAEDGSAPAIGATISLPRVAGLTHLCLSHPPPTASWRDLLSLAKHAPQITHLSLAYWPRPTLTPNLTAATISTKHAPDIQAGGSHHYSMIDKDLNEPAAILRQLSASLLRVQWLDLEGCAEWVPALAVLCRADPLLDVSGSNSADSDAWSRTPPVLTIFSSTWSNLTYIRCFQGWLPSYIGLSKYQPGHSHCNARSA
ncbi:hypothetical protein BAUCODRAFT_26279 [Baudoinia panamericana UAMH 10762]|uniref:Uncharacterized protein n=1 Tax=Baudoinia panamericana (strain UAMH 10762) TaxID=717646 RepID=M2MRI0_BAUPA|nr:uncharacterized protein BAUCODRAFT_26279 [Baudoinia panamericana UAMH 10762]EMC94068.1 hypothetical protein BAUCODRAFT_26279 [Baudoinia panamericana UAMH 10762]